MRFLKAAVVVLTVSALAGAVFAAEGDADKEKAWTAKLKASYVRTDGNTDTQTVGAKGVFEGDWAPDRVFVEASRVYAKSEGVRTTDRTAVNARYERLLTERFFALGKAGYLRDPFAGYNARYTFGPGLGYDIIKAEHHKLKGLGSVLYTYEDTTDDETRDYVMGQLAAEYKWLVTETVTFSEAADYSVSFDDPAVWFINSETALDVKMSTYLSLSLGYIVNHQNSPPDPEAEKTDTITLVSLVFEY